MNDHNGDESVQFDVKSFLQLLQKNNTSKRNNSSLQLDKLSVILSASEPQSSITDKENSNTSANGNYSSRSDECLVWLKEIQTCGLNGSQKIYLNKVQNYIKDLKKTNLMAESQLKIMEKQFEQEKKSTDEIMKALIKMDEEDKQLWKKYEKSLSLVEQLQTKNTQLIQQIEQLENDQEFMKKLVLVANDSYEKLEKKCRKLQLQLKHQDYFKQRKSSREILTRSTKSKKHSFSPSISQKSNISPRKNQFEENYRRLVLRTLKNKYK